MPFAKPIWPQGPSEVINPPEIEHEQLLLREIEALIPMEPVKSIVESVAGNAARGAVGVSLLEDLKLDPELKNAATAEFARIQGEFSHPRINELADLAREQVVRYWVKVLWSALERWPNGVRLGGSLLPTRELRDESWDEELREREAELLSYLPLNRPGLEAITRLFAGAVQQRLQKGPLELPRGLRVSQKPNMEVIAHRGTTPIGGQEDVSAET